MRVSQNSNIDPYLRILNDIQNRQEQAQLRISSGKDILNLSDDPQRLVNAKRISSILDRNEFYNNSISDALVEEQAVDTQISSITDNFNNLRQLSIDSTVTGNNETISTLGKYVKGILDDLLRSANSDLNGKYIFSGTKTTAASISQSASPGQNEFPFELVQGQSTQDNPSGLTVVFKGNNEDRIINKDSKNTEAINTKASDLFGGDGTDAFKKVINLYNVLMYNTDGSLRNLDIASLTVDDTNRINQTQKDIASMTAKIINEGSVNGSKMTRLELIQSQMSEESSQLKEYLSSLQDTDVAKTSIELANSQNALKYSLQVGSQLISQTIFDFLTL
jgi:flagellar hook-associated protein 3 FlgL